MGERNNLTVRRGRPPVSEPERWRQRLEVSRHAVRLFREHGVAATSGEQIAAAAGISERTLWRYFRTKESCVEPLLTKTVESFREVLRTWPSEVELADHLRAAYSPVPDASDPDIDAVLAVVRMTHDEPVLRAVYLVLRERADATLADVLAARTGQSADAPEIRMRAAATGAALCAATDHLVSITEAGLTPEHLREHRERLADFLTYLTDGPNRPTPSDDGADHE
ncbi:TetR/AcrR family transcriptional regulator [Stackebrandtia nassauensis]|uniref:Transcriptional regulator, TetR family n=1 Tax=Stackebrandtia nassauensis (strain DSM 44728 / CIP 108903 / NRRL B-16338 / NBRC 102104 / LLR-40K-21) TaxID=446470 RepID=D3Q8D5_STANL|nr:TetR/AcrR family transcriptional regulator [Stackebrandtia nassauensis]ADD42509.1 transcriptional regulator, TetR family [Stackebrandtia nassauensis DSM 44728]